MVAGVSPSAERSKIALFADALGQFGVVRVRLRGSSMLPALRPGDELTIRRRPLSGAKTGEIVVFSRDCRLIAHRVVAHEGWRLLTQGDTAAAWDEPVHEIEFLGVVESVSRSGKRVRLPAHVGASSRLVSALVRRVRASGILQSGGNARCFWDWVFTIRTRESQLDGLGHSRAGL